MSWITLKKSHVESRLASRELEVIEDTGGGSGDRLKGIIEQVIFLVRSKVAACDDNNLGEEGTIPSECLHAAATIAKHDLRATLPNIGGEDETEIRRDEYKNAMAFLDDVSQCKIGITEEDGSISGRDSGCYGGEPKYDF